MTFVFRKRNTALAAFIIVAFLLMGFLIALFLKQSFFWESISFNRLFFICVGIFGILGIAISTRIKYKYIRATISDTEITIEKEEKDGSWVQEWSALLTEVKVICLQEREKRASVRLIKNNNKSFSITALSLHGIADISAVKNFQFSLKRKLNISNNEHGRLNLWTGDRMFKLSKRK